MEDWSNFKPEPQGNYAWIGWTVAFGLMISILLVIAVYGQCSSRKEGPKEKRGRQLDPVKESPMPVKSEQSTVEEKKETAPQREWIWSLPAQQTMTPTQPSSTRHTARRPALMALRSSTKRE
jgi:hypothetical protein